MTEPSCIFSLDITSSLIGIAKGALACNIAAQRERVTVSGVSIKEDSYVLFAVGEAAAEIAASRAAILETVDRFWDMTVREDLARRHLTRGDRTFTDVAAALGVSDLRAFSQWFRRYFGLSPTAWVRKRAKSIRCKQRMQARPQGDP